MSEKKKSDDERQKEVDRQLALMKAAIGDETFLSDSDSEDSDDSETLKQRSDSNQNAVEMARKFLMDDMDDGDDEVMLGFPFPQSPKGDVKKAPLSQATAIGGKHERKSSGFLGWGKSPAVFDGHDVNLMDASQARASYVSPSPKSGGRSLSSRLFGGGEGASSNLSFPNIWHDANKRESDEFIQENSKNRLSCLACLWASLLWLVALGALSVFGYYIYDFVTNMQPSPSSLETPAVEHSDTIQEALVNHGVLTKSVLANPDSPQATALQWLIEDARQTSMEKDDPYLVQRYSLAVVYYSTKGEHWLSSEGWLSSQGYCQWHGVSCLGSEVNMTQHHGNAPVFDINLSSNQLRGTIPTELNAFQDLFFLDLKENSLVGTLPSILGGWTGLRMFSVSNNGLYGSIPHKFFSTTPDLRVFNAAHNGFTGSIPSEIGVATNLREVNLEFNELHGHLPDSIRDLDRLETLHLAGNKLGGSLPSGIYDMARLETLYLHDNLLTGHLSTDFAMLSHLELLTLNHNQFVGTVPNVFTQMRHLQEAHLHNNVLSGTMPPSMCDLRTLHKLSFLSVDCTNTNDTNEIGVSCECCTDCL